MQIRVSLSGDILAPAGIIQMETLIQVARRQAMKEAMWQAFGMEKSNTKQAIGKSFQLFAEPTFLNRQLSAVIITRLSDWQFL